MFGLSSVLISRAGRLPRFCGRRSRGFTLVELAITMSVLGLLIGLGLQPMKERLRNDDLRDTRAILQRANDAIISFAMSRGVEPRQLRVFGALRDIPGGRPYLPCPDVDGDGFEDRMGGGIVADPLAGSDLAFTAANFDKQNGHCRHYKGLLPWRTIGGPEADLWGTHLTYRVDPNFANSALGFDQDTRAESADTFNWLGETVVEDYEFRSGLNGTDAPLQICLVYDCHIESVRRGVAGTPEAELQFLHDHKAGLVLLEDIASGLRELEAGRIFDAPVFVIMSHGENRRGGVSADSGNCVPMEDEDDPFELQNAYYHFEFGASAHPLLGRGCYTRTVIPDPPGAGSYLNEAVFVDRPPLFGSIGGGYSMDDVLIWMSATELTNRMAQSRGLPPRLNFAREAR